jgi:TFIIF-interacting CTD phosphatase-like protein
MKKLTILDLDNTLIYGSTRHNLSANVLFKYSQYLTIYERPFAKQLVQRCHEIGDVVVFTTAELEYAGKICEKLNIKPLVLFARENCLIDQGTYVKSVPYNYYRIYDSITIIDDSPKIWDWKAHKNCRIIGVSEFTGEVDDCELSEIVF